MTPWTAWLAATGICLFCAPAFATQPDKAVETVPAVVGDALFAELIGVIGDRTELNYFATLASPPALAFVSTGDVIDYNGVRLRIEPPLHGLYDPTTYTIHLVRPWTLLSIRDQGVLLHELVHHAQHLSGTYACAAATEWEAHLVQDAFLFDRGVDSGFDFNTIAQAALCK